MKNNIIVINGPNLNLLGEREQSQYGSLTYAELKNSCLKHSKTLKINIEFTQSNIEGEIVTIIQEAKKKYDGLIINAAGFTHTSVAIRDALVIFEKPSIELHISNIYKREEFRHKSMISGVVTGIICGLGANGYILAINAMHELFKNGNR
jgi:3-dehydroquinate dehydratase II